MFSSTFQTEYANQHRQGYDEPVHGEESAFPQTEKPENIYSDIESSIETTLRVNFTRKVFGITATQLLFTAFFAHFFLNRSWLFEINYYFPGFVLMAGLVAFLISIALGFSESLSRKVPVNYILLGIFTMAEAYCIGSFAAEYDKSKVIMAVYLTAAVVAALALYAMQSKTEITFHGGLIVMISLGSLIFTFLSWITGFHIFDSLLFAGSCVLSGLYFIYDIKLLMGRERVKLGLDDYVRGAMHLYIDVIQLFINILQMLAKKAEDEEKERERQIELERKRRLQMEMERQKQSKRWF